MTPIEIMSTEYRLITTNKGTKSIAELQKVLGSFKGVVQGSEGCRIIESPVIVRDKYTIYLRLLGSPDKSHQRTLELIVLYLYNEHMLDSPKVKILY